MPILNTKLLLRVLLVVGLFGGGLYGVHAIQSDRVPDALLWQANNAAEKGKTDKAIFYMRQYLEFRPQDHDTAVKLADMMLTRAVTIKDFTNAHFLYERVLREAPQRDDVGRKLVTLSIDLGRHADALTHAQRLLQDNPNDGALLGQVAVCQAAQNQPQEARKSFEKAIALAPDSVPTYDAYRRLLVRHFNQPRQAGELLDKMVAANPASAEAALIRARFLKADGKNDECMRDLDRVFLLDPDNAEALVLSAELHQARGDLRKAKDALRDAIDLYPKFAHGYRALSWLELLSGNHADARATLERGVAQLADAPELLTPLADLHLDGGNMEAVEGAIKKLEARKDAASQVTYLRARMAMKQGRWGESLSQLESLRTEAVGLPGLAAQVNLLIAGCHERRGDRDGQFEALKKALTADPNHVGGRVALANAYLTAGRFEDALKEYQTATRSPFAGMGVHLTYASLRVAVARLVEAPPTEWQAITMALAKLRQQYPQAVDPLLTSAEVLAARGDFAGAAKGLRDAIGQKPNDARLWIALAQVQARGRGILPATEALSEGQIAVGDSVELRLARARLWAEDFQPGRERRIGRLEELSPTASEAERNRLMTGLLEVYRAISDEAGQKRVATDLAARNVQDLAARKVLLTLALKDSDTAAINRLKDEIRRIEGRNGVTATIIEALQQLDAVAVADRRLTDWQDAARTALAETPDHMEAHLLAARIAEKRGDLTTAAKHFEAVTDLDVTSVMTQQHRMAFYLRTGRDDVARRTLAQMEADPRLTLPKFRSIVEGAIATGGEQAFSKCMTWLPNHLKREPRSALWAGRMLEARGKVADALATYRQINESAPAFADAWSARLLASARVGEAEAAETMAAAAKALDRKAFFAVCAECGSAVRARVPSWAPPVRTAEDQRAYAEACISACEARGRIEDALPVLKAMADDANGRAEDTAWARRMLAALTAVGGNRTPEAVATLREGADQAQSAADARARVNALGLALKSASGADRKVMVRDMIALLAAIVRDPSATSNDWYHLAQLYRVAGDRDNARKCLTELTRREPNNLFYTAVMVDDLMSEGKADEAKPFVEKLAAGAADPRTLASACRYYTLTNQPKAALDLVEKFVRGADSGTTEGMGRQRQAADLLDQLTRAAANRGLPAYKSLLEGAAERYRASLRAFPEAVTPMAALLAFDGQVDAGFAEIEKQKARLSPTALVTAGVAVLRSGHATPRQFQTVQKWIEDALVGQADSLPLKLNLGELHALRQDFNLAEQVYRDVLKADPKNVVALNNLAWILAPRPEVADQAMKLADRAIALYGATGEMLDTRARILIAAGQYDRAVADLNDALNQSQTPLRYFHLAVAQMKMSKTEEAVKTFREARARGLDAKVIHPHDLPTYKALANRAGG